MHLMLIDPAPLEGGRTESLQFLQLADALAAAGAQATLVTPTTAHPEDPAAILGRPTAAGLVCRQVADPRRSLGYRMLGMGRSNKPFLASLRRWLRNGDLRVDAFYVRNLKLAEALLREPGLPPVFFHAHEHFARVFAESHDLARWGNRRKLEQLRTREKLVYTGVAGIVSTTAAILDDIRADYGERIPGVVVPNGVDLAAAGTAKPLPREAGLVGLYLGSLHPWKGVETVIRAMPGVSSMNLWVAGGDQRRIDELQALSRSLGISERVSFLGHVPSAKRFDVISSADICLLPLVADSVMAARYTSPLKIFEYMAQGKPIVASDLPSTREILADGLNAILVDTAEPKGWSEAISRLAADAELRQRLGARAHQESRHFGWPERAGRILAWLAAGHPERAAVRERA